MEKIPGFPPFPPPPPFVQEASDKAMGHSVTAWYTLQELEQDTDTIHDLLSLAGTSLPSLTGSKHDMPRQPCTKSEYSLS